MIQHVGLLGQLSLFAFCTHILLVDHRCRNDTKKSARQLMAHALLFSLSH